MSRLLIAPMTAQERAPFLINQKAAYITQRVEFGGEDKDESARIADQQYADFFPEGVPATGHHLFVGRDAETTDPVGILWLHERPRGTGTTVWIYDIEVAESARGKGWGRKLMQFAENWARERDATQIELNVFGGNVIARRLYTDLHYEVSSQHMTKKLSSSESTAAKVAL